jgi:hypothetical protein
METCGMTSQKPESKELQRRNELVQDMLYTRTKLSRGNPLLLLMDDK